jgi:hypothetical protein
VVAAASRRWWCQAETGYREFASGIKHDDWYLSEGSGAARRRNVCEVLVVFMAD